MKKKLLLCLTICTALALVFAGSVFNNEEATLSSKNVSSVVSTQEKSIPVKKEFYEESASLVANQDKYITKSDKGTDFESARLLVETTAKLNLDSMKGLVKSVEDGNNYYLLQFSTSKLAEKANADLNSNPIVVYSVPDVKVSAAAEPTSLLAGTSSSHNSWGAAKMGFDQYAEAVGALSGEVLVGVIDSGVDYSHDLLKDRVKTSVGQYSDSDTTINYDYGINFVDPTKRQSDDFGHGTHTAGTIVDCAQNDSGIKIVPLKVLDQKGKGFASNVRNALYYAADNNISVVNMSISFSNSSVVSPISAGVKYATNNNVVCVCSSGNNGKYITNLLPAGCEEAITVGAINENDVLADFSNYGHTVDVVAPGVNVTSSMPGNQYKSMSGTSMAAPHVAAFAAMLKHKNKDYGPIDIQNVIKSSCDDLGDAGPDDRYGYGMPKFQNILADDPDEFYYLEGRHKAEKAYKQTYTYSAKNPNTVELAVYFDKNLNKLGEDNSIYVYDSEGLISVYKDDALAGETLHIKDSMVEFVLEVKTPSQYKGFKISGIEELTEESSEENPTSEPIVDPEIGDNPYELPEKSVNIGFYAAGGLMNEASNFEITKELQLLGWSKSSSSLSIDYQLDDPLPGDGSIFLYPVWDSALVTKDEYPTPVKEGCTFDGWFNDPVAGQLIPDQIQTLVDRNYYAHWSCADWSSLKTGHEYSNNLDEVWTYKAAGEDVSALRLTFDANSKTSSEDYLEVYDGNKELVATLSGDFSNQKVLVKDKEVTFHFVSDDKDSDYGFQLSNVEAIDSVNGLYFFNNGKTEGSKLVVTGEDYKFDITPIRECQINLNANGGSVSQNSFTLQLAFDGWTADDITYSIGDVLKVDKDIDFEAKFSGVALGELPTPTMDGATFEGWYTEKNGGNKVSSSTVVSSDATYYAHWKYIDWNNVYSKHNYNNNSSEEWTYIADGTGFSSLKITFDQRSALADDGDYIEILDTNKNLVKKLTGAFGAETVLVNDTGFTIRLISNESGNDYGFKIQSLVKCKYLVEMNPNGGNEESKFFDFEETGTFNPMFIPTLNYDVTLDANGGEFKDSKGNDVNDFISFDVPFLGWADSQDATEPLFAMPSNNESVMEVSFTGSQTFYAVWGQVLLYTIDYASLGDVDIPGGVGTISTESANKFLPKIQREGYTFDGWYTQRVGGEKVVDETKLTDDIKLYAHWIADDWHSIKSAHNYKSDSHEVWEYYGESTVRELKLTFDSKSKTCEGDFINIYGKNNELIASLSGDEFAGDCIYVGGNYFKIELISNEEENEWGFELSNVESIMPFYEVILDTNGGNEENKNYRVDEGSSMTLSFVPTKDDYVISLDAAGGSLEEGKAKVNLTPLFLGWNSGIKKYEKDAEFTPQGDTTLKAIWADVAVGELPIPTKDNCIFDGWYTEKYAGAHIVDKNVVDKALEIDPDSQLEQTKVSEGATYYAHWIYTDLADIETSHNYENSLDAIWQYKCPYDNINNIEFGFDSRSKTASDDDYVQFIDSNGNVLQTVSGEDFATTKVKLNTGDFTIHFHSDEVGNEWGFKLTDIKYRNITVTFNPRNGETLQKEYFAEGESRTVDITPENSNKITFDANGGQVTSDNQSIDHEFLGWSTSNTDSTLDFPKGEPITVSKDTTLYAVYDKATIDSLPVPSKIGFEFQGWHTSLLDNDQVKKDDEISKDIKLYAHWKTSNASLLQMENNIPANTEVCWTYECTEPDVIELGVSLKINEKLLNTSKYYIEILDNDNNVLKTFYKGISSSVTIPGNSFKLHFKTTEKADGFSVNLTKTYKTYTYNVKYVKNNPDSEDNKYLVVKTDSYKILSLVSGRFYSVYYDTGFEDVPPEKSDVFAKFSGWSLSPTDGSTLYQPGTSIPITKDTTLYAFYENGEIDKFVNLPIVSKDKCTFDGWYDKPADGNKVVEHFPVKNDITLYAHWTINDYKSVPSLVKYISYEKNMDKMWKCAGNDSEITGYELTFSDLCNTHDENDYVKIVDSKGATVAQLSGDFGGEKVTINDTSYTVYFHSNDDDNLGVGFSILSCKPIYKKYSLTFDANGGKLQPYDPIYFSREDSAFVPTLTPTYETTVSYDTGDEKVTVEDQKYYINFVGWSFAKNDFAHIVPAATEVKGTENKTLYANWGSATLKLPKEPTREKYKFDGWYTAKVGGTKVSDGYSINSSGLKLYAHWKGYIETSDLTEIKSDNPYENSYEGTWVFTHPNPDKDALAYQIKFTTDSKTASTADYVEVIDENGVTTKVDTTYLSGKEIILPSANFTIHFVTDNVNTERGFDLDENGCKFIYQTHNLKYDTNGGEGSFKDQEFTKVTGTKVTDVTPKAAKFTLKIDKGTIVDSLSINREFLGWSDQKNATEPNFKAGDEIIGNKDVTLYAVWGDAVVGPVNTPTLTDCQFLGWYTKPVGGDKVDANTKISKDTTLYAHWIYSSFSAISTHHNYENNDYRVWNYQTKQKDVDSIKIQFSEKSKLESKDHVEVKNNLGKTVATIYGSDIKSKSVLIEHSDAFTIELRSDAEGNEYGFDLDLSQCQEYLTHHLTFDGNGGTLGEEVSFPFSAVTKADIPYTFYNNHKPIRQATVSFNTGDENITEKDKDFDFKFQGWAESKTETDSAKIYDIANHINIIGDKDKVLYAIWEQPSISKSDLPVPTKENYDFLGWYTESTGGTKIESGYKLDGDITLYAHWRGAKDTKNVNDLSEIETDHSYRNDADIAWVFTNLKPDTDAIGYQIKFTDDSMTASSDDYVEITDFNHNPVTVKDKEGKDVDKISGELLKGLVVDIPTSSFTIHFVSNESDTEYGIKLDLEKCKYIYPKKKLSFNSNGCKELFILGSEFTKTEGAELPSVPFDKTVTLTYKSGVSSIKAPSAKNYKLPFIGWSYSLSDYKNLMQPGEMITGTLDKTVYAMFEKKAIGTVPVLHRKNYEFLGFYTTADKKITNASLIYNDLTVTAKWNKITLYCPGIKTIKRSGTKATLTWSKKSSTYTGYQIQCATNSKFTKGKKLVKFKGYKTTKGTIKSLKKKTKYYFRARSYMVYDGHTYYSGWSTVKKK